MDLSRLNRPSDPHEPVCGVPHSSMYEAGNKAIAAHNTVIAAMKGRQGAECISCGAVIRKLKDGERRGVTLFDLLLKDGDYATVMICSELCRERAQRRGIDLG